MIKQQLRSRHISAPYLYFLSFAESFTALAHAIHPELEHHESHHIGTARATDDQLRSHMLHNFYWYEVWDKYLHSALFPF